MINEAGKRLADAAKARGESLAALSRMIGRNEAYLQQFVTRGTPRKLDEADRRALADYLAVSEAELGGQASDMSSYRQVARLGVEASAGNGTLVGDEVRVASFSFDNTWLRSVTRSGPDQLAMIRVAGDSMAPILADGDDILVDRGDHALRPRDGIFVLRRDDTLLVKRLAIHPATGTVSITSDNPAYPAWHDCPIDSIDIIGRVIWAARRFT